jgi:hypothetical protein
MGIEDADTLQEMIEKADSWPVWSADRAGGVTTGTYAQAGMYGQSLRDIAFWVALRESDRKAIRSLMGWPEDRPLRIDPLPERVGEAFSDLLYSEDPEFTAPNDGDQKKLDEAVEANYLPEQLRRWSDQSVTEGEVWWRTYVDLDQSEWPIIEAHSRLDVIPLFYGRRIKAIGFISDILSQEIHFEKQLIIKIWRQIEIQTEGYVRNLLYEGTVGALGGLRPLGSDPLGETAGLPEEWDHGLEMMLAGRVPNKLGRDFRLGISQLQGVKDLIMDLNESRTIMAENARNTAKARMVVSADQLDEMGQFDAGKDVVIKPPVDDSLEEGQQKGTFAVLEYTFQAQQLLAHINDLTTTILTRCGLAEQFVQGGRGGEGQAFTGTALRTRLIPTTLAAAGKGKFWDKEVPKMLKALACVANLPTEEGGCGQSFGDPEGKFVQKRGNVLPQDENEETQRHVMAVQGEVESIDNAVREMHPEWTEEEVEDEVKQIKKDHEVAAVVHDPNQPPGGPEGVADAPPKPGTQTADLRDAAGTRQPGTKSGTKGQSPGKTPAVNTSGGSK